jgi:cephalosporin-C deacetylase-like acetyl esterase
MSRALNGPTRGRNTDFRLSNVNLHPLAAVLLLTAGCLSAQTDPFLRWLDQLAQQELDAREKQIQSIHSTADAENRRQWAHAKFLEIVGGLPDYHGPLNARVTGKLTNASYTLEKVIFESVPHYYVTADVYRPNEPGVYPAVLLSAGHTTLGKTENHRIAANLAAKGFVAIAYDPVGLGERMQAFDARIGRGIAGCCTNEHLLAGAQSQLIGLSVARYFIWDAMRSIDYLVSRPDVDAQRIGAAGCSGGGCLTTYIGALDPRIKAAAPACFINSFRLLYAGPDPDSEMSLPRFLAAGLDHADFLEMAAPKPWLVLATEGDFFTPPAARMVADEAHRYYQIYGQPDRVKFFIGPGPHGTPLETREQIYAWMIRWLKDGKGDAREMDIPLYPDFQLQVTKSGQVENEPGSRKLYQLILEEYTARKQPQGTTGLQGELRRLGIPADGHAPPAKILDAQHLLLETEPGLEIAGTLYLPRGPGRKKALLIVKDKSSAPMANVAAAKGAVVLELEPRLSPSGDDHRPYLGEWLTNMRADTIGHNLAAWRAHDILRGVDYLASREDVDPSAIRVAGAGVKGIWVLLASAADQRISRVWLDHTPHSYDAAMRNVITTNLFDAMIPGFLLHWDLADLVRAMGSRRVLWTDPADWMNHTMQVAGDFRYSVDGQPDDLFLDELIK